MSTTQEYIENVMDQIDGAWNKRYRKMFGEYMVYINEKPILLVCDNTVFVKKLEAIKGLIHEESVGTPYKGAKEHFVLDIEDRELLNGVITKLERETAIPVKKSKKSP
ncbi:MAG: hypothetical protein ACRCRW_11250 [Aeromonadaceae bacterium]